MFQCFDLECFLVMNSEKSTWKCPICTKNALMEGLEVDQYIWSILNTAGPDAEDVYIDSTATWKPCNRFFKSDNGLFF